MEIHTLISLTHTRSNQVPKEASLEEGQTIEEIKQRFTLLREAYEEMRGIAGLILHLVSHSFLFRPNDKNRI